MDKDSIIIKILKWAGIAALIAVPVYLVLRKKKSKEDEISSDEESNIFAAELEE